MGALELFLHDEAETAALGWRLASLLRAGDVVCLSGPLGAGKTTLARGVIAALVGETAAPSPTFALVEPYETPNFVLWHFDLYRLETPDDVWELGLEDALASGVSLIEWPERIERLLPGAALAVRLDAEGPGRRARLAGGDKWMRRLSAAKLL